jgi:hypothetical protein
MNAKVACLSFDLALKFERLVKALIATSLDTLDYDS